MSKFLVVFKREYLQIVSKKSFIVGIFLTPILMGGFMLLPALLANKDVSSAETVAVIDRGTDGVGVAFAKGMAEYTLADTEDPAYRLVDVVEAGDVSSELYEERYDSLMAQVEAKEIKYLLVILPQAHLSDSNLYLVTNADNFRTIRRFEAELSAILSGQRLSESDINLTIDSVLALTESIDLPLRDTSGEAIPFIVKFFAALVFVMMIYAMIIGYGTMVMRSVIEEKSSRIMEVLVSSISSFQLMLGKVLGLGAAAFTQVLIWVIIGGGIALIGGSTALEINPSIARIVFNPVIVGSFVLFFITGYIMYSTFFALIGSIVNSDKEAQSFVFPITMSLIVPVMLSSAIIRDPSVAWAQILSFVPIFAPTLMLMRVMLIAPTESSFSFFSGILGEATLSLIIVIVFTMFVIWLTAKIFRVGILMYGKRPTLPEIIKWIKY